LESDAAAARAELESQVAAGRARRLPGGRFLAEAGWQEARGKVEEALESYARAHPLRWGPTRGELKALVSRSLDGELFDAVFAELASEARVAARGERWAIAPGRPLAGKHAEAARRVVALLEAAGFS